MSGHGKHDADDLHSAHDDHDETTSDDFPADEPRSPGWLPVLGGGLFLVAIFALVVFSADDKDKAESAKEAVAPAAVARPAVTPAARPIRPLPPGMALPPGHAAVPPPHP